MKVTNLVLNDFNKLQVSKIKNIVMDTSNTDTQLIIGSNGSGKSSILHELFPFPPIRSVFGKNGYKALTIQHNGKEYRLIFDINHGHSFICDGTNLNKNGNFDTQRELIDNHFQLNNNIHTILKCSLPIHEMTPSQRRKIIFDINPIDINVFLDRHKKVRKDVVNYGNNLDRLYDRHKQLISQTIPTEQLNEIISTRTKLETQEKNLLIWISRVQEELSRYRINNDVMLYDVNDIRNITRQLYHSLPLYFNIDRSSYRNSLIELPVKIDMLDNEIIDLERSIDELIRSISQYETQKDQLSAISDEFTDELNSGRLMIAEYDGKDFRAIDIGKLSSVEELARTIQHDIGRLYDIDTKIIARTELVIIRDKLTQINNDINQLNRILEISNVRLTELDSSMKTYTIPSDCSKTECQLYNVYNEHYSKKDAERTKLVDELATCNDKLTKAKEAYVELDMIYSAQSKVWRIIELICDKIKTSELRIYYNDNDIETMMINSPMSIYNDIVDKINSSVKHHEYLQLVVRVAELEKLEDISKSKQQLSAELINYEIDKYTKRFESLKDKYDNKSAKRQAIRAELTKLDDFDKLNRKLADLGSSTDRYIEYLTDVASIEYLNKLANILNQILHDVRSELIEIVRISKEQELLVERLDKEVNGIIEQIRPRYEKAKIIEAALAELPITYIKTFINNVIGITNNFISQIATYPIHIIPYDDTPTFEFAVSIDDEVLLKDISSCSDGQKAIIQLCFCLALIVELKYNDYPIYIDEIDRTLDTVHSARLTSLINQLVNNGMVSQVFMVNHHQSVFDGTIGDITVLNSDNIKLPTNYNNNTTIEYY